MVIQNNTITKNPEETAALGQQLAEYLAGGRGGSHVLCLYGQLGSGKTTFTQGFARGLGINTRLLSPTYIIVRRYQISKKEIYLFHVDLYRLQKESEMEEIGLPEIFSDSASYTVIEWAERLEKLLPQERIDIHFTTAHDDTHGVRIEGLA